MISKFSRLCTAASVLVGSLMLVSCASKNTSATSHARGQQKEQIVALLKSFETGDLRPVAVINPNKYIQHNLAIGDGLAGIGAVLKHLPKGSAKVDTVRVFQDGDFVFAHTDYDFFGPKIGFDIFRFEDGKVVEHWDNLQAKPASLNPSGRTMTDGPVKVIDLDKTQDNKTLVRSFVDDVLVNGRMDKLASYFDGGKYLQHNPHIGDNLSGLGAAMQGMAKHGIKMKYDRIHKVLGEGNFVLVTSEGELAGKATAFYDLFRVEGGKIAEHWDTIETIPPRAEWKNANGKF